MKSIFDIENRLNIEKEFKKLYKAFFKDNTAVAIGIPRIREYYTFDTYLNANIFIKWKYRDTFFSITEYLEKLGINFYEIEEYENYNINQEQFLFFIEFFLNMFSLIKESDVVIFSGIIKASNENLKIILEKMNYQYKKVEDRIIITKRSADVDSVLEIVTYNIANSLLEYNDIRTKNDIEAKKKILKNIDLYIEENIDLKSYDKELNDAIGTIVNKMGVNHPINEKPYNMLTNKELIKWYDKCFLLMIHAIRLKEVKQIKDERKNIINK